MLDLLLPRGCVGCVVGKNQHKLVRVIDVIIATYGIELGTNH